MCHSDTYSVSLYLERIIFVSKIPWVSARSCEYVSFRLNRCSLLKNAMMKKNETEMVFPSKNFNRGKGHWNSWVLFFSLWFHLLLIFLWLPCVSLIFQELFFTGKMASIHDIYFFLTPIYGVGFVIRGWRGTRPTEIWRDAPPLMTKMGHSLHPFIAVGRRRYIQWIPLKTNSVIAKFLNF